MKDLVILVLALIVAFMIWNSRVKVSGYAAPQQTVNSGPVSPEVVQAIIEKIREAKPDEYPIDTIYVKPQENGTYFSRFLFFNSRKFLGNQYDVNAKVGNDGSVEITDMSQSFKVDSNVGYIPDKYQPYQNIQGSTDAQLKAVLASRPETPADPSKKLNTRS